MILNAAQLKREAAEAAVRFVESGMVVGLGGGSTAHQAVVRIAELLNRGELHDVVGVPCSNQVAVEAERVGVPLTTLEDHPVVDLTIDGADEIDPALRAIKGGGGALLREKIVAQASRREIIIVDESKLSPVLGMQWALPVEVIPFGWRGQQRFLSDLGAAVSVRMNADGSTFYTDQGNLILDCNFGPIHNPEELAAVLERRTGIVDHGLFLGLITDLIVAGAEGIVHRCASTQIS